MHESTHRNRLAQETSPYLLQHASNPVDWHPWSAEALELARRENKPILLSIGYSACHWCHVMAHESFEDPASAAVMNELFVNIKVDREERPDLDRIYQIAQQMLTQRGGGWPLTMFLSPTDQRPFFGGTYFPKEARHGLPAFTDLLQRVAAFYRERSADIAQQSEALQQAFDQLHTAPASGDTALTLAPAHAARQQLAGAFDPEFGGFGGAPKFPHPTNIEFLLRQWRATAGAEEPDLHSLYMATLTLKRMADGGIYDQLGGGFARYSVDAYWMIPHFEKMLYDNGQLLRVYAHAALATGEPLFSRIASETADWMIRDMRSPEGAYWSALDADSEGHEGKFYVWQPEEVSRLLDADDYAVFAPHFGLDRPANFEGQDWHLHVFRSEDDIAAEFGIEPAEVTKRLERARRALLEVRNRRVWPGRDEKVLTSWNGLAISGLAVAARALRRSDLADAAARAVDFIRQQCWRDGRLLATYKDGRARFAAYLDDYAFLLDGVLELMQTRWRSEDLTFATGLAEALLAHFEDRESGGFFFTADDHEQLMHRSRSFSDEAVPAGNAIAAQALTRLGLLLGETRYLDAAAKTLRAAWPALQHYPHAHTALLVALEEHLEPPEIVIVRGERTEAESWRDELSRVYAPRRLVFAIAADAAGLPAAIADKKPLPETAAYVCRGMTCSAPVRSLSSLVALTRS
ncbi:thioredoxin domain-containing protein [Steroidobacter agaridevorans]|uniref:Thioredoxin domain-containing protein n=1 Tax=Steroidobacter agaridevorans TaxID=2695856 RepID=A0A829YJT3_9GAMM|nr:thioredoxin domain-containing protein [Steroidobacter agaridevorans]GFE83092.1 thioredoxin domain-containing protein [Steroidobacter agaridevorans]